MLKEKDKIKVHLYDGIKYPHKKIENKTENSDKVFTVCKKNGQLGIDFNTEKNLSICDGAAFVPFACFAPCAEFENVETGFVYHFSTLTNKIETVEEIKSQEKYNVQIGNCNYIIEQATELRALLSHKSDAMLNFNFSRALADIEAIKSALAEVEEFVKSFAKGETK